ncbi:MAG: c-type cytochrome [Flavobacteriaceae bacterium]
MKKVKYPNLLFKLSSIVITALLFAFTNSIHAQDETPEEVTTEETATQAPAADLGGDPTVGKQLFNTNCAACHQLDRKGVGPALRNVAEKYEKEWLYSWIKNSQAMIAAGDPQAVAIFEEYNRSVMQAFPQLTDTDIDNILAYTSQEKTPPPDNGPGVPPGEVSPDSGISNTLILVVLTLVMIMLVVMLFLVNNVLKKIAEANNVVYPEKVKGTPIWKSFIQNQFLVLVSVVFLMLVGAYYAYGFFMQVGVDQGYAPVQPIHFSHKIHAGDNQIDCNFCHSSARKSKHSGIPSLNVCMSCHENIYEYTGDEDIENGYTKEFYDAEIAKLYDAVGWDAEERTYSGEEQPVKWVRIHNLPDLAYFNHSQHVSVAGIACQTCHGPVEEMEILYQYSPLTMGWCIDCHRETNVDLQGNEYYEKIHAELSKKYGVEKLTAAQMGGMECGKCHY